MKQHKSKLFLFGLLLFVSCFIFYFNYGLPWNAFIYSNQFEAYLEDKYQKDFEIDEISYDFFHGNYHAYAHEINSNKIRFYIGQNMGDNKISDGYEYENLRLEAHDEIHQLLKEHLPGVIKVNVEVVDTAYKELEINVWTNEEIDNDVKTKLKTMIQEKGYICEQLFYN